jgi:hypothetical protein
MDSGDCPFASSWFTQYAYRMVEGGIHISIAASGYRILFSPFRSGQYNGVRQQLTIPANQLRDLLISEFLNQAIVQESRERFADEWIAELNRWGDISMTPIKISDELFDRMTVR